MGCGDGPARQDVETGRPRRSRIAQRLNVQGEYASPLRSLRPCGTTSLNILVALDKGCGYLLDFEVDLRATVCWTALLLCYFARQGVAD